MLLRLLPLLAALQSPTYATLIGHVVDHDGVPVGMAQVHVAQSAAGAVADARGTFRLQLPSGTYRLCIRFIDQFPLPDTVTLAPGDTVQRAFRLPNPPPHAVMPGCTLGERLLVLRKGERSGITATPDDRDQILWFTLLELHRRDYQTWQSLFHDSLVRADPPHHRHTFALLPAARSEPGRWLYLALSDGILDGVCHAASAVACPQKALTRYVSLSEPRMISADTAVVHAAMVTTIPEGCRIGDTVPYWEWEDSFFLTRDEVGLWAVVGRPITWPPPDPELYSASGSCPKR